MSEIFVFGSNLKGYHAGGAARYAIDHCGAWWGTGEGMQGNSYAIPTKYDFKESLPLKMVIHFTERFIAYAKSRPDLSFKVTRIGCGLAGFTDEQIAPLFIDAPENCVFSSSWREILTDREYFDEPT